MCPTRGHPLSALPALDRAIVPRLGSRSVFRTDLHGDVQITTDSHKLWIKTQSSGD